MVREGINGWGRCSNPAIGAEITVTQVVRHDHDDVNLASISNHRLAGVANS